ncbi:TPA: hypothetical protein SI937_004857, partial [Escherichia coli]|nr:hypothetical protein [Escherichia coli]
PANKARTGEDAEGSQDSSGTEASGSQGSEEEGSEDDGQTSAASQPTTPAQSEGATTETIEATPKEECGTSFVMWFGEGTPAATLKCGAYTIVYAPIKDQTDPAPRYISGEVTSVTFEKSDNTVKIKVNGQDFSTLSANSSSPTENGGSAGQASSRSRRSLSEETSEAAATVDLFAFTLDGGKRIEVAVPNVEDASKRDKYSLVADD